MIKWIVKSALKEVLNENEMTEKGRLEKDIKRLEEEKARAELAKRIEEEELKALVKIKEEKMSIESTKRELALQKEFNEKEMRLLKDHHNKLINAIEDQRKESKELYSAIMDRLPNVNVEVKRR